MPRRKAEDVDPTKPKGKITAYAYFIRHKHEQKLPELANLPFAEFSKRCSESWKSMTDEERNVYLDMAKEDKKRFEQEFQVWKANGGDKKAKAAKKKKKDSNAPKRPATAFFLFSSVYREKLKEEHPEFKVTEVARELGRLWKECSDEEKEKYSRLATEKKAQYKIDVEEYQKKKKELDAIAAEEERQKQRELVALEKQQQRQLIQQQKREAELQAQAAAQAEAQKRAQEQQSSQNYYQQNFVMNQVPHNFLQQQSQNINGHVQSELQYQYVQQQDGTIYQQPTQSQTVYQSANGQYYYQ